MAALRSVFVLVLCLVSLSLAHAAGDGGGGGGGGGSGGGGGGSGDATACTKDVWTCTSWKPCETNGSQSRKCGVVKDCPRAETPGPQTTAPCKYVSQLLASLSCHALAERQARIRCRLTLSGEERARERAIAYLPEECRDLAGDADKERCVQLYAGSQPCWEKSGDARAACLRALLEVGDVSSERHACGASAICMAKLRTKVYSLIKFKFYDLEEQAEELFEEGHLSLEHTAEIVTRLEEQKLAFNAARTKDERRQIILDTRTLWADLSARVEAPT